MRVSSRVSSLLRRLAASTTQPRWTGLRCTCGALPHTGNRSEVLFTPAGPEAECCGWRGFGTAAAGSGATATSRDWVLHEWTLLTRGGQNNVFERAEEDRMAEGSTSQPIGAFNLASSAARLEQELGSLIARHGGGSMAAMHHRVRLGAALTAAGRPQEAYPLLEQGLEAAAACFASNIPRLHLIRKEAADGTTPDAQQLVATLGALQRTIYEAKFFRCLCFVSLHGPAIEDMWHANRDTYLAVRHEMGAALPELARWSGPADPMVQCALRELSRLVAQCGERGLQQLQADLQAEHTWLLGMISRRADAAAAGCS